MIGVVLPPQPAPADANPGIELLPALVTAKAHPGTWWIALADDDLSWSAYNRLNGRRHRINHRREADGVWNARIRTVRTRRQLQVRWTPDRPPGDPDVDVTAIRPSRSSAPGTNVPPPGICGCGCMRIDRQHGPPG